LQLTMGLLPLEFSDCMLDSPYFRENLKAHEKQLEQTYADLKTIRKDIQDVIDAAKLLSKVKRQLATSLANFQFDCLGTSLTDDEVIISHSLREFSKILGLVEDEMDLLLEDAEDKFIKPLIEFRREQIECVRKAKKDFDKQTHKFCAAQDRYVGLKKEESLAEAAEAVRFEKRNLTSSSLEYVYLMHVVQERKKFEFVEALLRFMGGWSNYYRHGNAVATNSAPYTNDLRSRVQKTRENFSSTIEHYKSLKEKMITGHQDPGLFNKMYTRQGYLYVQNKKVNLIGGQSWAKHYCQYQAASKTLTMIPYSQINGKITSTETMKVASCVCREESAAEKFRFIVAGEEPQNPGVIVSHTIQAMSEYERKHWVEAMGGTWPAVNTLQRIRADSVEENLNSLAFTFLKDCLNELEDRGLSDQGLYRVGGVVSKVKKLLNQGLDPQPGDGSLDLADPKVWESKTIASAVKQYFRDLSKPLMTHTLYNKFIEAVKLESEEQRLRELQSLIQRLPIASREILKVLVRHLAKVAARSDRDLVTASNLGVCFGPTLLRPKEETVASIMDIKFSNQVIEILIENCDKFFASCTGNSLASDSSPDVYARLNGGGDDTVDNDNSSSNGGGSANGSANGGGGVRGRKKREKRGSSTPKRTQSFSSFSQLSTSSLPDIKEFKDRALAALSAATSRHNNSSSSHHHHSNGGNSSPSSSTTSHDKITTTEILNNRFRSKSTNLATTTAASSSNSSPSSAAATKNIIQSVMPSPNKPVIIRAAKSNNQQLIESLEMMKNLAADLPTNSPLKRSYTVHARKLTRQAPVQSSPSRKPPLPKASPTTPDAPTPPLFQPPADPLPTPPPPPPYSSNSSSACSSNSGSISQSRHRPPPPIPTHFLRNNSVPVLPTTTSTTDGAAMTAMTSSPPSRPTELFKPPSPKEGVGDEEDKDTPPPIPVRRYRRIYVNPPNGGPPTLQLAPAHHAAECYSSESSDLNPVPHAPPVPAPRFAAAPSPRPEVDCHVTSPSPLTADSGIAMSPPIRKVSELKKGGGGVGANNECDTVSVGSSLSHSDDSKYDNLSASSSTSLNSGGGPRGRDRTSTLVHAAAEIAAAKVAKPAVASGLPVAANGGEEEDYQSDNEDDSEEDEERRSKNLRISQSRIRRLSSSSSSAGSSCSSEESSGSSTTSGSSGSSSACCCCNANSSEDLHKASEQLEYQEIEINDHCVVAAQQQQHQEKRKSGPYENFIPPPAVVDDEAGAVAAAAAAADPRPPDGSQQLPHRELSTFQRLLAAGQTSNV